MFKEKLQYTFWNILKILSIQDLQIRSIEIDSNSLYNLWTILWFLKFSAYKIPKIAINRRKYRIRTKQKTTNLQKQQEFQQLQEANDESQLMFSVWKNPSLYPHSTSLAVLMASSSKSSPDTWQIDRKWNKQRARTGSFQGLGRCHGEYLDTWWRTG